MEHIEFAGVHSGDANIVIPPVQLSENAKNTITEYSKKIAISLKTLGLINIQYAVRNDVVYVLEANPRASRTNPFVSKSIGVPIVKVATKVILGEKLSNLNVHSKQKSFAVKGVVFPFLKLVGSDSVLGPEMRSTGETMGLGKTFEMAYYKALLSAGVKLKTDLGGKVLISLRDEDKKETSKLAKILSELGYEIYGTEGTVQGISGANVIPKIGNGKPDILDLINEKKVDLVINTPRKGGVSTSDGFKIRRASIEKGIPCITNIRTAFELLKALKEVKNKELEVKEIREYWGG